MTLEQLGGGELSRSFLSLVERGRSRISLRALAIVANRLELPIRYFIEGPEPDAVDGELDTDALEWSVHVRQLSQGHLSIEVSIRNQEAVRRILVDSPGITSQVDVMEAPTS
jgi:transcriptional regulator with XRE-family HTH domain